MNPPPELTNVAAIASCNNQVIALKSDGLISTWGYLQPGLSQVPPNLTNAIAVAAGGDFFMALTSQRSVVVWGNAPWLNPFPSELTNITAIAAGYYHALALKSDGTVVAWGSNLQGQTNIPPGLTNVIAIAASQYYNLALKKDGTLAAWGLIDQLPEAQIPVLSSRATTIAAGLGWGLALLAAPPSVLRLEMPSSNLAGGIFRLKLMGEFGQSIVVEASTNLSQWDRIAILTNTNGAFSHDDAAAGQFPQRFYRARSPNADEGSIP
jgi:alpha-tubulin suppressor-like RCC1 family protein